MAGSFCQRCGERLATVPAGVQQGAESVCPICFKDEPPYATAVAYGSYEAGLRELIHLLKYDRVRPAAHVLGEMLAQVIARTQCGLAADEVLVIPIPLHSAKLRERGFNQAELIAKSAMRRVPAGTFKLVPGLLQRRRVTRSQIGLSQNQRRENLSGAFKVLKPERVKEREILLVDDVFTTGTTVSACARVLRRAGARKVWVATVARTLKTSIHTTEAFEDAPVTMAG